MTRLVSIDDVPVVLFVGDQAAVEREARERWFLAAERSRMGTCEICGSDRTTEGKPLPVVRVHGGRLFKCFTCTTNPPKRRRSMATTTTTKKSATKAAAAPAPPPAGQTFAMLPLAKLKPAADNPRRDVGDVTEMAASMGELGVLEPFVTVQQNGHYLIVAGHRRYAAALLAGLLEVPAIVREMTDAQRIKAMLIENLQREDLTPLDEAAAYKRLVDEFGVSQRDLVAQVGRSQSHISKRIALLGLPKEALAELDSGGITIEEAVELSRIKDPIRAAAAWERRGVYGGLKRAVEDELDAIKRSALIDAEVQRLESAGVRAIAIPWAGHSWNWPGGVFVINKSPDTYSDALAVDPGTHATEPCHAIAVRTDYSGSTVEARAVCTNRGNHPKAKTGRERGSSAGGNRTESDQAREHREIQKVRAARREVAGAIANKGLHQPAHSDLVLHTLIESAHAEVLKIACRMLKLDLTENTIKDFGKTLTDHAQKSPQNRRRVEAAIAFGTHEEGLGVWYDWSRANAYFDLLELEGYEISDIERKKLKRPKEKAVATKASRPKAVA